MALSERNEIAAASRICVVSVADCTPAQRSNATTNSGLARIVVDRTARTSMTLVRQVRGVSSCVTIPAEKAGDAVADFVSDLGADYVVVSCNGNVNLDPRAITEVVAIAAASPHWATQYDLALRDRSGFIYTFSDFVRYRMIGTPAPDLPRLPSTLGNLLLKSDVFARHAKQFMLLPSATGWHRLMALRLISTYGAPLELPIIAGWRRLQSGLGKIDSVRHDLESLSEFLHEAIADATNNSHINGNLLLALTLQDRICRLLVPGACSSKKSLLGESGRNSIDRAIETALHDHSSRLALAADMVDQLSLSSLRGFEYSPAFVEKRIGATLQYAIDMDVFAGMELELDKLRWMAGSLLGDWQSYEDLRSSIAPAILVLVSALSQNRAGSMHDMLIDNLSRLDESMDENSALDAADRRISGHPVHSRAFIMAQLIRLLHSFDLVPAAVRLRDRLRRSKLVM